MSSILSLSRSFGSLEPPVAKRRARDQPSVEELIWLPDARFSEKMHSGFFISVKCCYQTNGDRTLLGNFGDTAFFLRALSLGIAIAEAEGIFEQGEANACRLYFLLYQWQNRKRASLKRCFQTADDFLIARAHRENNRDSHVLAHLRDMYPELGTLESVAALGNDGSLFDRIQIGLQVLAARHPLIVSDPSQIDTMTKTALFSIDDIEICNEEDLLVDVEMRLWRAMQTHLEETSEEFNKWFWGKSANLENRLAQRCNVHQEIALSRNQVKSALFEIAWRGHKHLGKMFELAMEEIYAHVPDLSESERRVYHHLYRRQPHLASLPLAMLLNYRRFVLEGYLKNVWDGSVDEQNIGALHRMLYFYSEMVGARRRADRRAKQATILELYDGISLQPSNSNQIIEAIPDPQILSCVTCESSSLDRQFNATKKKLQLNSVCRACGTSQPTREYALAQVREWLSLDE